MKRHHSKIHHNNNNNNDHQNDDNNTTIVITTKKHKNRLNELEQQQKEIVNVERTEVNIDKDYDDDHDQEFDIDPERKLNCDNMDDKGTDNDEKVDDDDNQDETGDDDEDNDEDEDADNSKDDDDDDDDEQEIDDNEYEDEEEKGDRFHLTSQTTPTTTTTTESTSKSENIKSKKVLSIEHTINYNIKMQQRGIIYIARIPPYMTPMKIKHLLSQYGEITRIFCQEQNHKHQQQLNITNNNNSNNNQNNIKKKNSGHKRYVEGWVEFANKKIAKQVAASLHLQRISNIKRNIHYDDYWCMKYLGKLFIWNMLTEKVAYEKRIREQKLRLETMQAKRDIQQYQQLYETNTKIQHIQQRFNEKKK